MPLDETRIVRERRGSAFSRGKGQLNLHDRREDVGGLAVGDGVGRSRWPAR